MVNRTYGGPGNPGLSSLVMPTTTNLLGVTIYAQGFVLDNMGVSGIRRGLADGVEFTLR